MEALALNHFDYIALVIILVGGFSALFRGFIKDFFSIMLWVAAVYFSITLSYFAFPFFAEYFHNQTTVTVLSYVAIFFVTVLVGTIVLRIVSKLIAWTGLGLIDKILGFAFGALKGFVILCAIYLAVPEQTRQLPLLTESKTIEFIKKGSERLQIIVDEFVLIYSDYQTKKSLPS
ncbi:MAG: CvpA family protein [Gammaproteobacteria bacterium]